MQRKSITEPLFHADKLTDIFDGQGKLNDYQATLVTDKAVFQKLCQQPYHIQKAINKELRRLESLDIMQKTEQPHDWVSNVLATPKSNRKVRLYLYARTINRPIERET